MKKSSLYIVLFLLLATVNAYSQKTTDKDRFTFQVQNEEGDLNKDKQNDKVIVEMDLKDERIRKPRMVPDFRI